MLRWETVVQSLWVCCLSCRWRVLRGRVHLRGRDPGRGGRGRREPLRHLGHAGRHDDGHGGARDAAARGVRGRQSVRLPREGREYHRLSLTDPRGIGTTTIRLTRDLVCFVCRVCGGGEGSFAFIVASNNTPTSLSLLVADILCDLLFFVRFWSEKCISCGSEKTLLSSCAKTSSLLSSIRQLNAATKLFSPLGIRIRQNWPHCSRAHLEFRAGKFRRIARITYSWISLSQLEMLIVQVNLCAFSCTCIKRRRSKKHKIIIHTGTGPFHEEAAQTDSFRVQLLLRFVLSLAFFVSPNWCRTCQTSVTSSRCQFSRYTVVSFEHPDSGLALILSQEPLWNPQQSSCLESQPLSWVTGKRVLRNPWGLFLRRRAFSGFQFCSHCVLCLDFGGTHMHF